MFKCEAQLGHVQPKTPKLELSQLFPPPLHADSLLLLFSPSAYSNRRMCFQQSFMSLLPKMHRLPIVLVRSHYHNYLRSHNIIKAVSWERNWVTYLHVSGFWCQISDRGTRILIKSSRGTKWGNSKYKIK